MPRFRTTRELGIDAAHRVPTHGSKCKNLHGHRYTVRVTVEGELGEGEEMGMTLDFGALKTMMLDLVDAPADHGLILWCADPLLSMFLPAWDGSLGVHTGPAGKVWVIPVIPTAEALAGLWADALNIRVIEWSGGRCKVVDVTVWETPNCSASVQC